MWWQEPQHLMPEVLESLEDGVMVIDREGIIRVFNQAAARLTGCCPEEAIGRRCWEVCRFSICAKCPVFRVFEGEDPAAARFQTPNPHARDDRLIESHTVLLRNDEAEIIGAMEIMRDVAHPRRGGTLREQQECFLGLVGRSKAMQDVYHFIELVAPSSCTVLIQGETGTGKELIAEAIHCCSPRAHNSLVKVNCSALPENLLESELFGHVKGAFTDALNDKPGRFELADGGTLLLDEVGDLTPKIQLKLLRVLERKEFERLGGVRTLRVDVRIIAATHRNLRELVRQGHFREDLYYRLHVVPIHVPPLRERKEDIALLVRHFLQQLHEHSKRSPQNIEEPALRVLVKHSWPGNARELQNVLEYASVVCRSETVGVEDLPPELLQAPGSAADAVHEREAILEALERHHWQITRTAQALDIDRTTLWRKMKRYGIQREGK